MSISNNKIALMRISKAAYNIENMSLLPNILVLSLEFEYDGTARILFQCDILHEVSDGDRVPFVTPEFDTVDKKPVFKMFVYDTDSVNINWDRPVFAPKRDIKKEIIKDAVNRKHTR